MFVCFDEDEVRFLDVEHSIVVRVKLPIEDVPKVRVNKIDISDELESYNYVKVSLKDYTKLYKLIVVPHINV